MISVNNLARVMESEQSRNNYIPKQIVEKFKANQVSRMLYTNEQAAQDYGYCKDIELAKGYKVTTTHNFDELIIKMPEITKNKTPFTNIETKRLEYILKQFN
jgi:hypothetical protein